MTRPIVKWAGGKAKLLPEILKYVPKEFERYHEPFLGGGAVFMGLVDAFRLAGVPCFLNDINTELMNVYEAARTYPSECIAHLQSLAKTHSKEQYYRLRAERPTSYLRRAVRFMYLNKTCFNGLYRVNASGDFNVPIGSYKNPTIVEPGDVMTWSKVLSAGDVVLSSMDFEPRLEAVEKDDWAYVDSPYLPRSKSADFTSYTAGKFGLKDHERLADSLTKVAKRGGHFLCSQGDSSTIRDLYKSFHIEAVSVRHSVGASGASRGKVGEVLISN